jgi:hypothetical protein
MPDGISFNFDDVNNIPTDVYSRAIVVFGYGRSHTLIPVESSYIPTLPPTTPSPTTPSPNVNYSTFHQTSGYKTNPDSSAFAFGMGDWTFECFLKVTKYEFFRIFAFSNDIDNLELRPVTGSTTDFMFRYWGGEVVDKLSPVKLNTWYHVAFVRYNGVVSVYLNGVLYLSTTTSPNITDYRSMYIGSSIYNDRTDGPNGNANGYFSNVRVVKGTALYKSAGFSIPNIPLTNVSGTQLLSSQSSSLINSVQNDFSLMVVPSSGNISISTEVPVVSNLTPPPVTIAPTTQPPTVNYSTFHQASGYKTNPDSSAFAFGTGDWTFECFLKVTKYEFFRIFSFSNDIDNLELRPISGSTIYFMFRYWGGQIIESYNSYIALNTWYHVACVRYNGTISVYVNGVLYLTTTTSPNTSSRSMYIGSSVYNAATDGPNGNANGYFSNVRVVKGVALYKSAGFSIPNIPLTNVAGTQLLSSQSSALINSVKNDFSLMVVPSSGNISISTEVPVVSNLTPPSIIPVGCRIWNTDICQAGYVFIKGFKGGDTSSDSYFWTFSDSNYEVTLIKYGTTKKFKFEQSDRSGSVFIRGSNNNLVYYYTAWGGNRLEVDGDNSDEGRYFQIDTAELKYPYFRLRSKGYYIFNDSNGSLGGKSVADDSCNFWIA